MWTVLDPMYRKDTKTYWISPVGSRPSSMQPQHLMHDVLEALKMLVTNNQVSISNFLEMRAFKKYF